MFTVILKNGVIVRCNGATLTRLAALRVVQRVL